MTSSLDLALLAGSAYNDTRSAINRFPVPTGWTLYSAVPSDDQSGFEARVFQSGTELVISYAGTYAKSGADIQAGINLGLGLGSAQLHQAVEYYLQIKDANPSATISLTGHENIGEKKHWGQVLHHDK